MEGNIQPTRPPKNPLSRFGWVWFLIAFLLLAGEQAEAVERSGTPPKQKLVFGCDQDFPPFEWMDEAGRPQGFNVDLIRAIGQVMGYDVEVRMAPWPKIRDSLENGRTVDVTDMFHTEEREKTLGFAKAFRVVHDEIFIRQGTSGISSLADLHGREVICQRGGSVSEILGREMPRVRLILVDGEPEALRLLSSGHHDCAVVSEFTGRYVIQQSKLSNLIAVGSPMWPRNYGFVTVKGREDLLADINQGLAILRQTGRYDVIHDSWFGDLTPRHPWLETILDGLPKFMIGMLVLVVTVATWILTLKRRVNQRTRELQKNQVLFDGVVNNSPSMIFIKDREGRFLLANQRLLAALGMRAEDVEGKTGFDLFPRETAELHQTNDRMVAESGQPLLVEESAVFADGIHEYDSVKFPLFDSHGRVFAVAGIASDITTRKSAEEHARRAHEQLRELSDRMESVREEERAHLSREAHDVLGQLLTCLKMELAALGRRHGMITDAELRGTLEDRLSEAVELVDALIHGVQKISSELRPSVFDQLGLAAAIRFEAGRFAGRGGIETDAENVPDSITLDPDAAIGAFRVFQEVLTNIARHAQATRVEISLMIQGDAAVLEVQDNGIGITEAQLANEHSLGLLGMRERVRRFNGVLRITGHPGEGTKVRVEIPLEPGSETDGTAS
jgi:PAS domain S-box-containing protein